MAKSTKSAEAFKILFLSYIFPPSVGGIETYMQELTGNFKAVHPFTYILANTRGLWFLPIFIPLSTVRAIRFIKKHGITHLHSASGPHCFQALLIRKFTGVKASVTIHGLDIIIPMMKIDRILAHFIRRLDGIYCVSNATKRECVARGIPEEKCTVIFNGVDPEAFPLDMTKKEARALLERETGIPIQGKKLLITNGRLIRRKGVEWFIRSVVPRLDERFVYLVSGDGPERGSIEKAIAECGVKSRVLMLGKTNFQTLRLLYNSADVFVMPNIRDPGTMEGFGLVILEAGSCGIPVVAADIEGISDAVIHGTTGWLAPERDTDAFIAFLRRTPLPARKIKDTIRRRFNWKAITTEYLNSIRSL
jgi:phosphatidyl-myo-inositol dimannoside synthase